MRFRKETACMRNVLGKSYKQQQQKEEIAGYEIFIQCLAAEGVDVIFGYSGASIVGIHDVLYDIKAAKILKQKKERFQTIEGIMQ